MKYKKNAILFVMIVTSIVILFLTLIYIYDPMQIFHKTYNKKVTFHKIMREQNAGIINNYSFDSMILGTSMLENTSADEASKIFGGKFVNLSMSGSDFYERKLVLEYALKKKNIKRIIYSLDMDKYIEQKRGSKRYPTDKFNYLYDDSPFNDFKLYLNNKYIECLISFSKEKECIGSVTSLDRPSAWYKSKYHAQRYGGLDNWFKAKNSPQIKVAFKTIVTTAKKIQEKKVIELKDIDMKITAAKHYIDDTLLKLVQNTPTTEFILFFPPYSRMYFAMLAQYDLNAYSIHQSIVQYMASKTEKYSNLKVFFFEHELFLDDIANYKDPKHYHHSINSWMLGTMNKNISILNKNSVDRYMNEASKKALEYNLTILSNKIDNYLEKTK